MPLDICLGVLSNAGCTKQRFNNYKISLSMQMSYGRQATSCHRNSTFKWQVLQISVYVMIIKHKWQWLKYFNSFIKMID